MNITVVIMLQIIVISMQSVRSPKNICTSSTGVGTRNAVKTKIKNERILISNSNTHFNTYNQLLKLFIKNQYRYHRRLFCSRKTKTKKPH